MSNIHRLYAKCQSIVHDPVLDWCEKYGRIFSPEISGSVGKMITLDYYDPDTSYEEDVLAFVDAFTEYMETKYPDSY